MGRRLLEGGQPPRQLVRVNLRKDWLAAAVGLCLSLPLRTELEDLRANSEGGGLGGRLPEE